MIAARIARWRIVPSGSNSLVHTHSQFVLASNRPHSHSHSHSLRSAARSADSPRIGDPTPEIEPALAIELILRDPLCVSHQRGRVVLVFNQMNEIVRPDARLVTEGKALGQQLDKAQLERVADQSTRCQCRRCSVNAWATLSPITITLDRRS